MSGLESAENPAHSPASSSSADRASQDYGGGDNKKLRRREKNRIAAQRSRKKQTLKADQLHEDSEGTSFASVFTRNSKASKVIVEIPTLTTECTEEYEGLEQENTALKREIRKLSEEVKHLSDALKDHERACPMIRCTMNFATTPRSHPNIIASCLSCEGQSGVS
ncbi:basic leucine zipper transcriptional factor ATF-like 3 isoform X1 [Narcine bancroftii]|uniref:basic leucine zipper transcriptional factor ATF-like 3 isoform X1 n=1 Tax=Narcine bancroftii TaxID=1343680 RepID=UPI0038310621